MIARSINQVMNYYNDLELYNVIFIKINYKIIIYYYELNKTGYKASTFGVDTNMIFTRLFYCSMVCTSFVF